MSLIRFEEAATRLPDPSLIEIESGLRLETLHVQGDSPCVVFLHGGLGSLWDPYPQLIHLKGSHELVTYSLAGNGRSDDRSEHSLEGHVTDLVQLLDKLGIEEEILAGWSYGTALALEYAKTQGARGILLTGGGSHNLTPRAEVPVLKAIMALRLYAVPVPGWFLRRTAKWLAFHRQTPLSVVDEMLKANPFPRRRSAWETVTKAFWGYDGRAGLQNLDMPVLVAHGPADRVVPITTARETAELVPNAKFVAVENTGHASPVERPEAHNGLLDALIAASLQPKIWPSNVGPSSQ